MGTDCKHVGKLVKKKKSVDNRVSTVGQQRVMKSVDRGMSRTNPQEYEESLES